MKFEGLSGTELIQLVYSRFHPQPVFNPADIGAREDYKLIYPIRLYCPKCRAHNRIRKRDDVEGKKKTPWYCSNCKSWSERPLALRKSGGGMTGHDDRGAKDTSSRLFSSILASKVMCAVEDGDPLLKHWAFYAYTDKDLETRFPEKSKAYVHEYLIQSLNKDFGKMHVVDAARYLTFTLVVLESFREQVRTGEARYSNSKIAKAAGVNESQFREGRKWDKLKKLVENKLREIDTQISDQVEAACFDSSLERLKEGV